MRIIISFLITIVFSAASVAQENTQFTLDSTTINVSIVATGLRLPWDMVWGPDGRIWFTERSGNLKRLDLQTGLIDSIFHIDEVFESGENSGLHSMALHPNFPQMPYIYFQYTYGTYSSRIVRYTYDSVQNTLTDLYFMVPFLNGNTSHNGSRMQFDQDGTLYISVGDAYLSNEFPQDLNALPGKVLRMNWDGSVPADNPFSDNLIWSWGHRNPQGLVIASNGKMYETEHGPDTDDELNMIEKGRNYGWPYVRGFCDAGVTYLPPVSEEDFCADSNVMEPLRIWTPTQAPCGIEYYNHTAIPEWTNALLIGFLKEQRLKFLKLNSDGDEVVEDQNYLDHMYGRIRDVLMAPDGRVFVCTSNLEYFASPGQTEYDIILELSNAAITVGERELTSSNLRFYPNPSVGDVNVQMPAFKSGRYELLDNMGRVVRHGILLSHQKRMVLARKNIPSGSYQFKMITDRGVLVKSMVFR